MLLIILFPAPFFQLERGAVEYSVGGAVYPVAEDYEAASAVYRLVDSHMVVAYYYISQLGVGGREASGKYFGGGSCLGCEYWCRNSG